MGSQIARGFDHLKSVASTDGDDGEPNLLQLLPVEDESTTSLSALSPSTKTGSAHSKTKAGRGQLL
jgi:hypothetical protein